jgi:hypothetical protein
MSTAPLRKCAVPLRTGVDYAEGIRLTDPAGWRCTSPSTAPPDARTTSTTSLASGPPACWPVTSAAGSTPRTGTSAPTAAASMLVDLGGGPGVSGGTAACVRCSPSARSRLLWGSPPGGCCVAGTAPRTSSNRVTVVRVEQATGRVYYRRFRKRKRLFAHNRGVRHRERRARHGLRTRPLPHPGAERTVSSAAPASPLAIRVTRPSGGGGASTTDVVNDPVRLKSNLVWVTPGRH